MPIQIEIAEAVHSIHIVSHTQFQKHSAILKRSIDFLFVRSDSAHCPFYTYFENIYFSSSVTFPIHRGSI